MNIAERKCLYVVYINFMIVTLIVYLIKAFEGIVLVYNLITNSLIIWCSFGVAFCMRRHLFRFIKIVSEFHIVDIVKDGSLIKLVPVFIHIAVQIGIRYLLHLRKYLILIRDRGRFGISHQKDTYYHPDRTRHSKRIAWTGNEAKY